MLALALALQYAEVRLVCIRERAVRDLLSNWLPAAGRGLSRRYT